MNGAHLAVVVLLSLVRLDGPDDVACVLNHHFTRINVPLTEEATAVNGRPGTQRWRNQAQAFKTESAHKVMNSPALLVPKGTRSTWFVLTNGQSWMRLPSSPPRPPFPFHTVL